MTAFCWQMKWNLKRYVWWFHNDSWDICVNCADRDAAAKIMMMMITFVTISITTMIKDMHLFCSFSFYIASIFKLTVCLKFLQSFLFYQLRFSNLLILIVILTEIINMWMIKFQKSIRDTIIKMSKSHSNAWTSLNDLMIKSNSSLWKKIKQNFSYKMMMFTIKESLYL